MFDKSDGSFRISSAVSSPSSCDSSFSLKLLWVSSVGSCLITVPGFTHWSNLHETLCAWDILWVLAVSVWFRATFELIAVQRCKCHLLQFLIVTYCGCKSWNMTLASCFGFFIHSWIYCMPQTGDFTVCILTPRTAFLFESFFSLAMQSLSHILAIT